MNTPSDADLIAESLERRYPDSPDDIVCALLDSRAELARRLEAVNAANERHLQNARTGLKMLGFDDPEAREPVYTLSVMALGWKGQYERANARIRELEAELAARTDNARR